jgi:hypothetical protein
VTDIHPRKAPSRGRQLSLIGIWLFPYILAAAGYTLGYAYESAAVLRSPVFEWPIPQGVYGWLLLMVLLAGAWLVAEFISVTNRETVVLALQWDAAVSSLTGIVFTGLAGWYLGVGELQWWLVVPWIASVLDALTSSWLGINNAAQKPFLSQRGTM